MPCISALMSASLASINLPILPNKVDPTTGEEIENTVLYTTPDGEEKVGLMLLIKVIRNYHEN